MSSSYFDIVCRDCKSAMHKRDPNQEMIDQELQKVVDNVEAYLALGQLIDQGVEVNVRVGGEDLDLAWLQKHKGHRLAVSFEHENWTGLEERLAAGRGWWEQLTR